MTRFGLIFQVVSWTLDDFSYPLVTIHIPIIRVTSVVNKKYHNPYGLGSQHYFIYGSQKLNVNTPSQCIFAIKYHLFSPDIISTFFTTFFYISY